MKQEDVDMGEFYKGYTHCRKRKRNTLQEQTFSLNITHNLINLRNRIITRQYVPLPVRSFITLKPVRREIFAPEFVDRSEHHHLADKLEPLLEKELIYDCYSCRKGKGTLFGINRLKRFIAQCSANYTKDCYVLQCDIKGYFMNINREQLWERLEKFLLEKYKGVDLESVIWQFHTFLFTSPLNHTIIRGNRKAWIPLPDSKSLFCCSGAPKPCYYFGEYTKEMDVNGKGLTIGAVLAQMLANFFLSIFDHFCKSELKIRFYGRYVDDFFMVALTAEELRAIIPKIRKFLKEILGLTLHPNKIRILHYKQGIPFLGAYIKGAAVLPGKRIQAGFRKILNEIDELPDNMKYSIRIEKYVCRLNSYLGMMRQYDAKKYVRKMLDKHPRIKFFFQIAEENKKVTSMRTLMEKQSQYAWRRALIDYHEQFRKRNLQRRRRFHTKEELYDLTYYGLYGIMPSIENKKRWDDLITVGKNHHRHRRKKRKNSSSPDVFPFERNF